MSSVTDIQPWAIHPSRQVQIVALLSYNPTPSHATQCLILRHIQRIILPNKEDINPKIGTHFTYYCSLEVSLFSMGSCGTLSQYHELRLRTLTLDIAIFNT